MTNDNVLSQHLRLLAQELQTSAQDKRHYYLPFVDLNHLIGRVKLMGEMALCLEELREVSNARASRLKRLFDKMSSTTIDVLDSLRNKQSCAVETEPSHANVIPLRLKLQSSQSDNHGPTGGDAA